MPKAGYGVDFPFEEDERMADFCCGGSEKRIDAWLKERPVNQAALLDERTGEKVSYLFQLRGKRMGSGVINLTIIPMLCASLG